MHSCIITKETKMKAQTISIEDAPKEILDVLDTLLEAIKPKSPEQAFKRAISKAASDALQQGVEGFDAIRHLQVLAALILMSQYDAKDGVDERKAFKEGSGLAYDIAVKIRSKVEGGPEDGQPNQE